MKYLKKFATEAEIFMTKTPNAVLVEDTKKVLYNVDNSGVYIQHIDGKLYKREDWVANAFDNSLANGVAVIAPECSFVVAKDEFPTSMVWSNKAEVVEGLPLLSKEFAILDYNGEANTMLISEYDPESSAMACKNYVFPNGANGYLPALGEIIVFAKVYEKINTAMSAIGGKSIGNSNYYWSSTQASSSRAWMFGMYGSKLYDFGKSSTGYSTRAFAPLNI